MHALGTTSRTSYSHQAGFTLLEVLASAFLICLTMGSIVTMNAQAAKILRTSREAAATSQILQQRVETLRERPWLEIADSTKLATLFKTGADSEAELLDPDVQETLRMTVPKKTGGGLQESDQYFAMTRTRAGVKIQEAGSFLDEQTLLFEGSILWHDGGKSHERSLRTVICRAGLTRGGIMGTVLGRPGSQLQKEK